MSLLWRLFVIFFAFLVASFAAGVIVVVAVMYPEFSNLGSGRWIARYVVIGFGFIFVSGFALLPAMIMALVTEAFSIRSICPMRWAARCSARRAISAFPFDPETMRFVGVVRRELEVMTGAGIVAGLVYWVIAGRTAGAWREPPQTVARRHRRCRRIRGRIREPFHAPSPRLNPAP